MKIAIDIDGTLSRYPERLSSLAKSIVSMGGYACLLTGHSRPDPSTANSEELQAGRKAQIESLGIGDLDAPIHICVGRNSREVAHQKGEFCRDNQIDIFIDDSKDYCEAVRRLSPNTTILWVWP